jgi:hypothetical protein
VYCISGQAAAYIEPSGCGGFARRVQMLADLRAQHTGLVVLDLGGFGGQAGTVPVTARAPARLRVAAVGLPLTSLAPLAGRQRMAAAPHRAAAGHASPPRW